MDHHLGALIAAHWVCPPSNLPLSTLPLLPPAHSWILSEAEPVDSKGIRQIMKGVSSLKYKRRRGSVPIYRVLVAEHLSHEYIVEAENQEEAEKNVEQTAADLEPNDTDVTDWFVAAVLDAE
jgi:hypothetical protein